MPDFVSLDYVPEGEPSLGGWCPTCLLPSLVTQRLVLMSGTSELGYVDARWCEHCGPLAWSSES